MTKPQRFLIFILLIICLPCLAWLIGLNNFHHIPDNDKIGFFKYAVIETAKGSDWRLLALFLGAMPLTFILAKFVGLFDEQGFKGQSFKKFLRGTKIVSKNKLISMTKNRKEDQVTISQVPVPTDIENLHFLLNGSTGAGKSVTLREMINGAITRANKAIESGQVKSGDRLVIVDPNGDMFSKFGKKGDVLLNPFDKRTSGWSVFNEIRDNYDYTNYTLSIVPRSSDGASEEWNGYGRVILESIMKTLKKNSGGENPTMEEVAHLATVEEVGKLKEFLAGTDAESMFVEGSDKALGSARFILSKRLPIFKDMPQGDFSIRDFLENGTGNLYITWKESQKEALKPIISAWIDIICSSILSLPENKQRKIWLFLDELASLDNIASLEDALTKGRKNGLRVVAGIQSVSQLVKIYGREGATIIMSCFRSLIVMGGSSADPETSEAMSKALGEHEIIRETKNKTSGSGKMSTSRSEQVLRERVVMPSEISSLPNLEGILALAGNYPLCRFKSEYVSYKEYNKPFVDIDL